MQFNSSGIVTLGSRYGVAEFMDRLQKILQDKGVTIFARIDQAAEAQKAGLELTPIELLIFGNPKAGTPIMSAVPLAGLDLPLKVLAWEGADKKTRVSYNDPAYLRDRYSLPEPLLKSIDFSPLVHLALA